MTRDVNGLKLHISAQVGCIGLHDWLHEMRVGRGTAISARRQERGEATPQRLAASDVVVGHLSLVNSETFA